MAPSIDAPFAPASGTDSKIANKQQVQQDQQVEHGKGALKFAQFDVAEQVFLERDSVLGIVNLMPIVPGHVLIIPRTPHKRFSNLSPEEVAAVFQTVQETSNVLEKAFGADAMTVSIQDGAAAGQSVPHLHVHILPRRKGDFEPNDLIYQHLERFGFKPKADGSFLTSDGAIAPDPDSERKPRTKQEMKQEAQWLASFFDRAREGGGDSGGH